MNQDMLEASKKELEFLYDASRQLVVASTSAEILEAVSGYARAKGAVSAALSYFESFEPQWLEVMAAWATHPRHLFPIGLRMDVTNRRLSQIAFANPTQPTLVEDVLNSPIAGPETHTLALTHDVRGVVLLPLYSNGRWVGDINFNWKDPYLFDSDDKHMYTALQQYAASAIASIRLFKEAQHRAVELEIAKSKSDTLYDFASVLLDASTPQEVLDAISVYARENGAVSGHLFYVDETNNSWIEMVAQWSLLEVPPLQVGWRLPVPDHSLRERWLSHPEQPTLIMDVMASERVTAETRDFLRQYGIRGFVALPLNSKGRWIGLIYFLWDAPHEFDLHDEQIFAALQRLASPTIDSLRLLDQTRKRAIELEQTNQELTLLYRASEVINKATTYEEVVEVVAHFDPEAEVVTLMLWEGFDWQTASYLEVVTVLDRKRSGNLQAGMRMPKQDFPIAKHMLGERIWVFEDALTDPRMDPVTAQSWALLDIRSFMGPALYVGTRWVGGITFHASYPRKFEQRHVRLFAAIGDLVGAAVERIRLQRETESSRKYAEMLAQTNSELLEQSERRATELEYANTEIDILYRIGATINAASSYNELVNAVLGTISGEITAALYIWENWNFDSASYVELVAATGNMAARSGLRVPKEALAYTQKSPQDRLVIMEDIAADPRLDPQTVATYLERDLHAVMSIRLYIQDRWIGALTFQSSVARSFSARERRLASGVGDYVQGAVQRIRLQQETEAARRAAEVLATQAQRLAALEERNRLARELHDSVSQVLYSISLWGHSARAYLKHDPSRIGEPVDYILSLAEVGLSEMRTLIFELRPELLEEEGLVSALRKQTESLQARHGIQIKTEFCTEPNLEMHVKSDLYRIAREALHNTLKHAQASEIALTFIEEDSGYRLEVRDNGMGFDTSQSFPGHLGLKSMQERASALNGTFELESSIGGGTRLSITFPR